LAISFGVVYYLKKESLSKNKLIKNKKEKPKLEVKKFLKRT
jgi:hypothetical protein